MHLERGESLGRVDEGKSGLPIQNYTWNWELLKRKMMLKRTGAGSGVAGTEVQTVEKVPTWSSLRKSNHSLLAPFVQCSQCCNLKYR